MPSHTVSDTHTRFPIAPDWQSYVWSTDMYRPDILSDFLIVGGDWVEEEKQEKQMTVVMKICGKI